MRVQLSLVGLLIVAGVAWSSNAVACGDKFIVGPSGVRIEQSTFAARPARILIYHDISTDTTAALSDPELISALKDGGHSPVTASGAEGLENALTEGSFDIILVDYASAQRVRDEAVSVSSHPTIIPVLNRAARQYLSEARHDFTVVMNVPATVTSVLSTINKAMSLR